jgi:putative endonuclease
VGRARTWFAVTLARQRLGRRSEAIVAARLQRQGWRIVERNARSRHGEIDLIAIEGPALVFLEVKAGREGSTSGPERPALAVGPAKRRRLRRLARAWLAVGGRVPPYRELRFDVVGVTFGRDGSVVAYEHLRDAF